MASPEAGNSATLAQGSGSLALKDISSLNIDQDPKAPLETQIDVFFNRLTPEDRLSLFTGTDFNTRAIPRLGVPIMDMPDASQRVRGGGAGRLDGRATYFGSGVLFVSTWHRDLVQKAGQAIGEELPRPTKRRQLKRSLTSSSHCGSDRPQQSWSKLILKSTSGAHGGRPVIAGYMACNDFSSGG